MKTRREAWLRSTGRIEQCVRAAIAAIFCVATILTAQAQAPAGDPVRGKAAYMKYMCYTCHGTAGQGGDRGSGPRIIHDVWPYEAFAQQTRRPRESMPRYPASHLSDAELADIYAYVAGQKKGTPAKDISLLKE